jgi:hypothetical protein
MPARKPTTDTRTAVAQTEAYRLAIDTLVALHNQAAARARDAGGTVDDLALAPTPPDVFIVVDLGRDGNPVWGTFTTQEAAQTSRRYLHWRGATNTLLVQARPQVEFSRDDQAEWDHPIPEPEDRALPLMVLPDAVLQAVSVIIGIEDIDPPVVYVYTDSTNTAEQELFTFEHDPQEGDALVLVERIERTLRAARGDSIIIMESSTCHMRPVPEVAP